MKINIGDTLAIELLNKMYMFVKIIYQIPRPHTKKSEKINPNSYLNNYIKWYPGFYIINVYKHISKEMVLKNNEIMFKGVWIMSKEFKEIKYKIILQNKIDIEDVEFPEAIGANRDDGFFLEKGELKIKIIEYDEIKNYPDDFIKKLEKGPSMGFMDIYSLGDSVLYFQNRKNEMQKKYFDGWKFYPNDLKHYPELRNEVYKIIKENPNEKYYDIALKYGFDLKKLYE
jgi:hypothetical protein